VVAAGVVAEAVAGGVAVAVVAAASPNPTLRLWVTTVAGESRAQPLLLLLSVVSH
jgi:hypothetical protein